MIVGADSYKIAEQAPKYVARNKPKSFLHFFLHNKPILYLTCRAFCCPPSNTHLQEHPELLSDVMKAMEMRLDHARVVDMFRKEKSLPLIKDYLLNVQKTNILEVREGGVGVAAMWVMPPCMFRCRQAGPVELGRGA